ncbi:MAG TPA: UvrD-helicase domain-containing protein, partial [Gammaproteobacteria bacterium]|nr:UvrD-helicase domain-containing protein [Gammaproteobacteria bacterium]
MITKLLASLNEKQQQAVSAPANHQLILAGAGSGKTRVLVHRMIWLIATQHISTHAILAVTFTNKAAGEMQSRVAKLLGKTGMPLISTFHSLGVRLLREFSEQGGVARGFSIWDRDDSTRAIKKALEKLGMSEKPGTILAAISRAKGEGMVHHEYSERARTIRERAVAQVWNIYDSFLKEQAAVDFDDLLLLTLLMLRGSPEILKLLQNRWSHITIDE